ncbi:hypothetical protein GCM10009557_05800 [Virgisporangium ochraceum]|uniref:Uncharacterized protein n=1 Tax=Virgisporangium ochraceum TaxID=65505 RepID=A0A8J4EBW1_9ACTN|nr:hypothetical protein [Virgisporangium ochraceum]GIJ66237.1 hypothetical protein Voc01_011540 [Virgisporangium ochraceum]
MQIAGAIGAIGGALAAIGASARWVRNRWRPVAAFLEDWNGRPGRPGHDEVPGIPARLRVLEQSVATIRHEVTPNSGGSLKDAVDRIDAAVTVDAELLRQHVTWHQNEGHIDPTARVALTRD